MTRVEKIATMTNLLVVPYVALDVMSENKRSASSWEYHKEESLRRLFPR